MNDKIRAHMALVEEYAGDYARATTENLYGTSKSYTKQCFELADEARAAVESSAIALQADPYAELPYPAATTLEGAAEDVAKWLNERPDCLIDLRNVAMLVHAVQQAEQAQPVLPRLENCGRYYAQDVRGQWHYVNHAGTWATCPSITDAGPGFVMVPTVEELADKIASMLHGTYHCTRVWNAWSVGTMSQDDFEPLDESETPNEIAAEIHAMLTAARPSEPPKAPSTEQSQEGA